MSRVIYGPQIGSNRTQLEILAANMQVLMPTSIDQENSGTTHPANVSSSSKSTGLEPMNQPHDTEGTIRDYDDQETMRLQVESELEMATGEIESLMRKIELEASRGRRRKNGAPVNRRKIRSGSSVGVRFRADSDDRDRDDFRTTLAQANACIKSLNSLSRPINITPSSIALVIYEHNLRVRYEINLPEVVQAIIPALSDRCSMHCRAAAYRSPDMHWSI
ncbi:hypothetical protein EDD22DRAFT_1028839 [Suillus occidentalis]|nr:hypothetical protein EDD22DRAFT_1028839 [Suillus occidentalis]